MARRRPLHLASLRRQCAISPSTVLLVTLSAAFLWIYVVTDGASDSRIDSSSLLIKNYITVSTSTEQHFHACAPPNATDKSYYGVSEMRQEHVWLSKKPARPESITIVTQLTAARLPMLMNQCLMWNDDRIAAALYAAVVDGHIVDKEGEVSIETGINWNGMPLIDYINRINEWHENIERNTGCLLDMELFVEEFATVNDTFIHLYPVNAMRNRAHQLAQTEAILLLDVDFIPSANFAREYQSPTGYEKIMKVLAERKAFVFPAFESVNGWETAADRHVVTAAFMGKATLIDLYKAKRLDAFSQNNYTCHAATNYAKWFDANESYEIDYSGPYEPYLLTAKAYTPWYDERYRGYFSNKISHRRYYSTLGVRHIVHPTAFVLHMFHYHVTTAENSKLKSKNFGIYTAMERELHTNAGYKPVTSFCAT